MENHNIDFQSLPKIYPKTFNSVQPENMETLKKSVVQSLKSNRMSSSSVLSSQKMTPDHMQQLREVKSKVDHWSTEYLKNEGQKRAKAFFQIRQSPVYWVMNLRDESGAQKKKASKFINEEAQDITLKLCRINNRTTSENYAASLNKPLSPTRLINKQTFNNGIDMTKLKNLKDDDLKQQHKLNKTNTACYTRKLEPNENLKGNALESKPIKTDFYNHLQDKTHIKNKHSKSVTNLPKIRNDNDSNKIQTKGLFFEFMDDAYFKSDVSKKLDN